MVGKSVMGGDPLFLALEAMGKREYRHYKDYTVKLKAGKKGPWSVGAFEPKIDLRYLRLWRDGRPPGIGKFTALRHENRGIVMSDTVPEIRDMLKYIDKLQGNVLITGLGLGMAVRALTNTAHRKGVRAITVIEKDPDVIALIGSQYAGIRNLRIINADAYEWVPDRIFDSAWHDVWDMGGYLIKEEKRAMRKHYRKYVATGRQYCWG